MSDDPGDEPPFGRHPGDEPPFGRHPGDEPPFGRHPGDELFALPPEEFVAARDALAKQLRADGDRPAATEVKALRRPTVAAWALNQLARGHPQEVARLVEVGAQLATAQRKALSGVRDSGLRAATDARHDAVRELRRLAVDLLSANGRDPAPHIDAVVGTLSAAVLDEAALAELRAGRLSKELAAPAGFGAVEGLDVVGPAAAGEDAEAERAAAERRAATRREAMRLAARADEAGTKARAAAAELKDARREAERAAARLRVAEERLAAAQQRAERAAAAAEQAREALD